MLVMIIEKVPAALRPTLSGWLTEPKEGVFIGNATDRVREELWAKSIGFGEDRAVIQIWTDPTSGRFNYRQWGARNCGRFDTSTLALSNWKIDGEESRATADSSL